MAKAARIQRVRYRFQYAVKFICTSNIPGTSQTTDAFLPGVYQTAVNIHNPQTSTDRLDVVEVYNAGGRGEQVTSIDVEQIKERKLGR